MLAHAQVCDTLKSMKTLGQAAKEIEIPKGTLRGWVGYYADFLSDDAKPPKGEVKQLDDDDMAVLWTVYFLRAKHKSKSDIVDALADGDRFFPEPEPAADAPGEQGETTAVTAMEAFSNTLQLYESRVSAYEDEVRELRERLLTSENQRVAAETRLQVTDDATAPKPGFWARMFGKKE